MNEVIAQGVFDGVMASDGGLTRYPPYSCFYIRQSGAEHIDWLTYIKDALGSLGVEVSPHYPTITQRVSSKKRDMLYDECALGTRSSPFLCSQYKRWYPDGKKEVPEDFKFTPLVLANEFMGDGSSHRHALNSISVYVFLHTQSFSLRSIEIIEQSLRGMGITTSRSVDKLMDPSSGSGIKIFLLQESVDTFMSIVEPYVLPSYKYKIKYKRR